MTSIQRSSRPISTATSRRPTATRSISISRGLGLPDRDYYLKPEFAPQREAYAAYAAQIAVAARLGRPAGAAAAGRRVRNRRSPKTAGTRPSCATRPSSIIRSSPAELAALAPGFDWNAYLAGAKLGGPRPLHRRPARRLHPPCRNVRRGAARHGQGVDGVPRRRPGRALSRPRPSPTPASISVGERCNGQAAAERALEARRCWRLPAAIAAPIPEAASGRFNWGVGQLYAERYFPAETKAAHRSAGRRRQSRLPPPARASRLDEPGDPGRSAEEARHLHDQGRLSRQMARLFQPRHPPRRPASATSAARPPPTGNSMSIAAPDRSTRATGA